MHAILRPLTSFDSSQRVVLQLAAFLSSGFWLCSLLWMLQPLPLFLHCSSGSSCCLDFTPFSTRALRMPRKPSPLSVMSRALVFLADLAYLVIDSACTDVTDACKVISVSTKLSEVGGGGDRGEGGRDTLLLHICTQLGYILCRRDGQAGYHGTLRSSQGGHAMLVQSGVQTPTYDSRDKPRDFA